MDRKKDVREFLVSPAGGGTVTEGIIPVACA